MKQSPGRREEVVIITKAGCAFAPHKEGLSAQRIAEAADESLQRLQTDYIDIYLSHYPDPGTPIEQTLAAYDRLLRAGKVRAIGGSNYAAAQLREALCASVNSSAGILWIVTLLSSAGLEILAGGLLTRGRGRARPAALKACCH